MVEYLKVENEASLSRAMDSGAIINTNKKAFESYMNSKTKRESDAARLDILENELSEIKQMLIELLKR